MKTSKPVHVVIISAFILLALAVAVGSIKAGGGGLPATGVGLTPGAAVNFVGTSHTVTAHVRDSTGGPVEYVTVTFSIVGGPNTGAGGSTFSDASGEATFTWSSTAVGTDTVEAMITDFNGNPVYAHAQKTWIPTNNIPEVPIGTIMAVLALAGGFGAYYLKGKIRIVR
jgi:hypothetical protein